jgi:ribonuclease HI
MSGHDPRRSSNRWRNTDLWKILDTLAASFTCQWVKGHSGHPDNERCDELAEAQAARLTLNATEQTVLDKRHDEF